MCEITIDNFDSKFQEITYSLQKANFVGKLTWKFILNLIKYANIWFILTAIDTEFTGLHLEDSQPRYIFSNKAKKSISYHNLFI